MLSAIKCSIVFNNFSSKLQNDLYSQQQHKCENYNNVICGGPLCRGPIYKWYALFYEIIHRNGNI